MYEDVAGMGFLPLSDVFIGTLLDPARLHVGIAHNPAAELVTL